MKKRIIEIDILRSIAVLWIVAIWHFTNYCDPSSIIVQWVFNNKLCGDFTILMLSLFMFMSGLFTNIEGGGNVIKTYFCKKFWRFYPLYMISVMTLYFTSIPSHITFYSDINQILFSLVGLATLTNHAPSTLWFMDLLLFFIIVTPVLFTSNKRKWWFVFILYGLLCCLFKLHYIDLRVVLYMPFYFIGLSISPDKYLEVCKKYGLTSLIFAALIFMIPYRNVFITTLQNLLLIMVCEKITIVVCTSRFHKNVIKMISFFAYSSMCAYFFHRQIYAIGIYLSLPVYILPIVIFILSYTIQKIYDTIVIKAKTLLYNY